jgi:hypothetical protein
MLKETMHGRGVIVSLILRISAKTMALMTVKLTLGERGRGRNQEYASNRKIAADF